MKQLFKKILPLLGLTIFFLSCNFSDNPLPVNPFITESRITVPVTLNFSIAKDAPSTFQNISSASTNTVRSATAGIPATIQYFVEAVTVGASDPKTVTVFPNAEDIANKCFSIGLTTGFTWKITVGIKDTSIDKIILKDTYEKTLTVNDTTVSHHFSLKPQITAGETGKITLDITVPDSAYTISIVDEDGSYSDWNSHISTTSATAAGVTKTINIDPISSGTYVLKITFSKTNTVPIIVTQSVTVYDNLTTNTWLSGGNALINSSGNFVLDNSIINAANEGKKIYYVDGTTGNDNNTGNVNTPLQTVYRAVALINAIGNTTDIYKIYVKDGTAETVGTNQINIGDSSAPRKVDIETYLTTPGDKLGTVTLTQTAPVSLVVVPAGATLTISGNLVLDGNNKNCNGILSSGTLTMNGGLIKNCYQAGVNTSSGVFNFFGGKIQNNRGNGIYVSASTQFNVKGNVTVYDNCTSDGTTPRNVYLLTGKVINVVGPIDASSKIGVTTQTVPTLSASVQVTSNYSTYRTVSAGTIFKGDVYGIKEVSGEAYVAASGGALTEHYSDAVEIIIEGPGTVWKGSSVKATVTVKKNGTTVTSPTLTLESFISSGSIYNSDAYRTFVGNELTLLNNLVEGKYIATVSTVIEGTKYTGAKTFTVAEKEKTITSGNFNTSTILSDVFRSGRTSVANIRPLIASTHEVTQKEYEQYCSYGGSSPNTTYGKSDESHDYPAYWVNWYDAILYCNLRTLNDPTFGTTTAERLTHCVYALGGNKNPVDWDGKIESNGKYRGPASDNSDWNGITFDQSADGWRLPTEAEWEYLARGGNLTASNQTTYSGSNAIDDVAWYTNSGGKTQEVCTKAPNGLGLYDMSGNVWEWCWDWNGSIDADTGAAGPDSGSYRVRRGGSWGYYADYCKVSSRGEFSPSSPSNYMGFRVVRNAQ